MRSLFHKISFKIIAILVASCCLLAVFVSVLGDRAGKDIALRGVVAVAENQTAGVAGQLFGPLRFKKFEDATAILEKAGNRTDLLVGFVVRLSDGTTISWPEAAFSSAETERLSQMAEEAYETGTVVRSDANLIQVHPVQKSADTPPVAAVAAVWTKAPFMATIAEAQRNQLVGSAAGLAVLIVLATLAIRRMVACPLQAINTRATDMVDGDLDSVVPGTELKSEVGELANALEDFRGNLAAAKASTEAAFYDAAGFQASSASQVMCDTDLTITQSNAAFTHFLKKIDPALSEQTGAGRALDFFDVAELQPDALADAKFPLSLEFRHRSYVISLSIEALEAEDGQRQGYVLEFRDITELQKTAGILSALEETALRADFDEHGKLVSMNPNLTRLFGGEDAIGQPAERIVSGPAGEPLWQGISAGKAHRGKFSVTHGGNSALVEGSVNPIKDASGKLYAFVILGTDVTQAELELSRAKEETDKMVALQEAVVAELRQALSKLADGVLSVRIEQAFQGDYDVLRRDFNSAIAELESAFGQITDSAGLIHDEASNVSFATESFSTRAEQQATTLAETSATISELSTSVAAAAENARKANEVLNSARSRASQSGTIVEQSVAAMREISDSADQISRIIDVIDQIAFQTNLLALNAGVEAARAGDAGRGFAVVASEVRDLAQRASTAASEISELISNSGEQVNRGVDLVDKAGKALTEISASIGEVAQDVANLAASSEEQASSLRALDEAMTSIDKSTQESATSFKSTTDAARSLTSQTEVLKVATSRFDLGKQVDLPEEFPVEDAIHSDVL